MKVSELIEELKACNPDDLVVMSKDGEGNSFSHFSGVSRLMRFSGPTWNGEIGYRELDDELIESGYSEEDVMEEGEDCIVLWPV